jgi:ribosomal protein L29
MAKAKKTEEKKEQATSNQSELRSQIRKLQEELFNMKLEHAQGKLKNTSSLTFKRKEIARLFTSLRTIELTQ